jgi:hypothetical protein
VTRRHRRSAGEQARRRHAWLKLVQTSGPFLILPGVDRVFPNGLAAVPEAHRSELRAAIAGMLVSRGAERHRVIEVLLHEVLGWGEHLQHDQALPDSLAEIIVEHGLTVHPDFAFHAEHDDEPEPDDDEREVTPTGPYRLLGMITPWGAHPLTPVTQRGWTASPAERLAVLLRARDVPIGLVTDGRWWAWSGHHTVVRPASRCGT